jgi:hypothetical protein
MEHAHDLKNSWDQWKHEKRKEYPGITDEELLDELKKDEELLLRLQKKTGKTKKEIFNWLHLMG